MSQNLNGTACVRAADFPIKADIGERSLTVDSLITVVGTIVTLIGTAVTIWQAAQARSYKKQIQSDTRRISLYGAIESIKRAQDEIRKLTDVSKARGIKRGEIMVTIRSHFDVAFGVLHCDGPDQDIRNLLSQAQEELNLYDASCSRNSPDPQRIYDLQTKIQDVVSRSNGRIYKLEGRA